jgi:hypothetical protein
VPKDLLMMSFCVPRLARAMLIAVPLVRSQFATVVAFAMKRQLPKLQLVPQPAQVNQVLPQMIRPILGSVKMVVAISAQPEPHVIYTNAVKTALPMTSVPTSIFVALTAFAYLLVDRNVRLIPIYFAPMKKFATMPNLIVSRGIVKSFVKQTKTVVTPYPFAMETFVLP